MRDLIQWPWDPNDLPDGVRGIQPVGTTDEEQASCVSAARIRDEQQRSRSNAMVTPTQTRSPDIMESPSAESVAERAWNPDDLPDGVRGIQSVGTTEEQEASRVSAARIRDEQQQQQQQQEQEHNLNDLGARTTRRRRRIRGVGYFPRIRLDALSRVAATWEGLPTPSPSPSSVSGSEQQELEVVPPVDFSQMEVPQTRAINGMPPRPEPISRSQNYISHPTR